MITDISVHFRAEHWVLDDDQCRLVGGVGVAIGGTDEASVVINSAFNVAEVCFGLGPFVFHLVELEKQCAHIEIDKRAILALF
jgi:hypothetical protein